MIGCRTPRRPRHRLNASPKGWAVAGTAYKRKGWAVEETLDDVDALAHPLPEHGRATPARALLAYDIALGTPSDWRKPGDVRDDLDFESEVVPILIASVAEGLGFGKFQVVRLVTGIPGSGLMPPPDS